MDEKKVQRMVA
jgi:hypothetical protein